MDKTTTNDGFSRSETDIPLSIQPCIQNRDYPHSWWIERHKAKLQEKESLAKPVKLVFIGDSITQAWEDKGHDTWSQYYDPVGALNLGFNGDCTEHVLWRIENGALDNLTPKLIIIMIGTNNAGHRREDPQQTFMGIQTILNSVQKKCPQSNILLLAIFPRGKTPNDPLRMLTHETNQLIKPLADNKRIRWLDINPLFLNDLGELTPDVAEDFLHINEEQYRVWANAMATEIKLLLYPNHLSM